MKKKICSLAFIFIIIFSSASYAADHDIPITRKAITQYEHNIKL